jgi:hypothetical protein
VGSFDHVWPFLLSLAPPLSNIPNRALYMRNDPYETSDAVFGVKQSLIVDFIPASPEIAEKYGVPVGSKVLKHDFVLVDEKVTESLRDENALAAMKKLGRKVKLLNHLPVPDLD